MCSSDIRLGSWNYLKQKHIIAILNDKKNEVIAAKIRVYADEDEEYNFFYSLGSLFLSKKMDGLPQR